MKVRVVVKGNTLLLKDKLEFNREEIEIEIPEEYLQKGEKSKKGFCESIRETIDIFPESPPDWKKEWHKHLEEKYNG